MKKITAMIIALVLVTSFFAWRTHGKILMPQNITNIIAQNAYVFCPPNVFITGGPEEVQPAVEEIV